MTLDARPRPRLISHRERENPFPGVESIYGAFVMSPRAQSFFIAALLAILGCGGGTAAPDASSVDARWVDGAPPDSGGPSACDPSADAGTLVNPGFVRPSQVTQVYVGTASVGDADWSCLRTKTTDMPTSVSVTVSGVVLDFQTGDWVVGANVDVWATADTSGQPVGDPDRRSLTRIVRHERTRGAHQREAIC